MIRFSNITKGNLPLIIGFSAILMLMLLLTAYALNRITELNQQLQQVVSNNYQKVSLLLQLQQRARDRVFTMQQMLLLDDPFEIDELALRIDDHGARFASARKQLQSLSLSPEELQLLAGLDALIRHGLPIQREATSLIVTGRHAEGQQLYLNEIIPAQQQLISILADLEAIQATAVRQTVEQAKSQHADTQHKFILMCSVALLLWLLILLLTLYFTRRLTHQAHHDLLTELPNRRGLEMALQVLLRQELDGGEHFLCLMDLDYFKPVNDTCGHAAGDTLLKKLAQMMRTRIRSSDLLARVGGDEFVLLLKASTLPQAYRISKSIQDSIGAYRFQCDGNEFQLGISIGIVPIAMARDNKNSLMALADKTCYSAKGAGRNQIHLCQRTENMQRIVEFTEELLLNDEDGSEVVVG